MLSTALELKQRGTQSFSNDILQTRGYACGDVCKRFVDLEKGSDQNVEEEKKDGT